MSDDDNNNHTVPTDFPVDTDHKELLYNDNPASLAGLLHEVNRFYETHGLFQPLLLHGSTPLSNGRLAITKPSMIPFIDGTRAHSTRSVA